MQYFQREKCYFPSIFKVKTTGNTFLQIEGDAGPCSNDIKTMSGPVPWVPAAYCVDKDPPYFLWPYLAN